MKWTIEHEWQAAIRTYELAAELAREDHAAGKLHALRAFELAKADHLYNEEAYREALAYAGLVPACIDREVRRVDTLARGVLVRETVWIARYDADAFEERGEEYVYEERPSGPERASIREHGGHLVRVTRIRRKVP